MDWQTTTLASAGVTCEIVTDTDRLDKIGRAWQSLWQQAGTGIFQSQPWIKAWWHENSNDFGLRIVCAWRGHELLAVLPLCIRRWNGVRMLEWTAQAYSDYCDAIVTPDQPGLLALLWNAIIQDGGFDLIRLKHVRRNAIVYPHLQQIGMFEERTEVCLQVRRQWSNGEAWFRTLNKKTRQNQTRGSRVLAAAGPLVFRLLADDEPRQPIVSRLLALKRLWAANRDSPLVRRDTTLLALVEALDAIQSLRIFVIECDGVLVAGSVNAIQGTQMLAMFATYDPQYEKASPGTYLMTEYTKWAFDHGIDEIDYLLGAEPYKFKYANQQVALPIMLLHKTLRGRVALGCYQLIQRQRAPTPEIIIGSAYLTEKGTPRKVEE